MSNSPGRSSSQTALGVRAPSFVLRPNRLSWFSALAVVLLAVIVYYPSLRGGFIFDDDIHLTENDLIRDPDGLYKFWCTMEPADYWPVSNTSLWLEWRCWGKNPTGYRVTNLLLHCVECLLIGLILRKMEIPGAFFAALLFAVHPVNVESVAWISQRKNLLALFFLLLSTIAYLWAESKNKEPAKRLFPIESIPGYVFALLAFLLAILSKGSAVILPGILILLVAWRRKIVWKDILRLLPFVTVALVLTYVNIVFASHGKAVFRHAGMLERCLQAGAVVWFYLYKAVWPFDLAFIYPKWNVNVADFLWWLPLFAALAVTVILWCGRKTGTRPCLFVWGFFTIALLPVMGFTDVGFMQYSYVADHYQHIALIGITAILGAAAAVAWRKIESFAACSIFSMAIVAIFGVLAAFSFRQSALYGDSLRFYDAAIVKNSECWALYNNYGMLLESAGRIPDAMRQYERALELDPNNYQIYTNCGNAFTAAGRHKDAVRLYKNALDIKPGDFKIIFNLGKAYGKSEAWADAIPCFEDCIRIKPDYVDAYLNLGRAHTNIGHVDEAIDNYKTALQIDSQNIDAYMYLALIEAKKGRMSESLDFAEKALKIARCRNDGDLERRVKSFIDVLKKMAPSNRS